MVKNSSTEDQALISPQMGGVWRKPNHGINNVFTFNAIN